MNEEKEIITLEQKDIMELEEIVTDTDKDLAFEFLLKKIYEPILKNKKNHMQSHI